MTAFLSFLVIVSTLIAIVGVVLFLFRRTRRRGKQLALSGIVACVAASGFGAYRDHLAAQEAGFRSGEDFRAAQKEGVADPEKWREIVRERSAVERAVVAKERLKREAQDKAAASAQAHPRYVAYDKATDAAHIMMMSNAMDAIRQRLRDPQAAEFRNVHLATGSTGITVTCGEVNSKNAFGGYAGFVGFISNGVSLASLPSDFKNSREFLKSWKQLCQ